MDLPIDSASSTRPSRWQQYFFKWIDRRHPTAINVYLNRKNLFIFPTTMGFAFLGLSLLLWVLGTNYQNNLILGLSYLLISLLVVSILHTYANLAGLNIKIAGVKPTFVGQPVHFIFDVSGIRAKGNNNLTIKWWAGEAVNVDFYHASTPADRHNGQSLNRVQLSNSHQLTQSKALKNATKQIAVGLLATQRGYLRPGKLLIESTYPLGLIRCWTWLNLDACAVVFPKPLKFDMPLTEQAISEGDLGDHIAGGEDFSGLKQYRAGDPIKHIAWKHYAREQGLYSKEYTQAKDANTWLQWQSFLHLPPEDRLSALCYWALEFDRLAIPYGLRLPGKQLPPALGDSHRLNILSALARFDIGLAG